MSEPPHHEKAPSSSEQSQVTLSGIRCSTCGLEAAGWRNCPNDGTPLSDEPTVGSEVAGGYRFLSLIGTGGMSAVYKASHPHLNRIVAIKLLHWHFTHNSQMRKRFQQEAQAISNLSHPNIVSIHEFGLLETGQPYIVMDYIDGNSLQHIIEKEGKLSQDRVLPIMDQICSALAQAHDRGIWHRDLKPSNIMVASNGNIDTIKIVDFGIAKLAQDEHADSKLTETGDMLGSPPYMSPEQCQGQEIDGRSDIYSLGCVLYECLTGQQLFHGKNALETIYKHLKTEPPSLNGTSGQKIFSPRLQDIVSKTLVKNPDQRYRNVSELRQDLHRVNSAGGDLSWTTQRLIRTVTNLLQFRGRAIAIGLSMICVIIVALAWAIKHVEQEPATTVSSVVPTDAAMKPIADDKALEVFIKAHPAATDIDLYGSQITDAGVHSLTEEKHLQKVNLDSSNVTDEGISNLTGMTQLQSISLRDTRVGDRALDQIAKLPNVNALFLAGTHITDKGVSRIAGMKGLTQLSLSETSVTADGIKLLATLPRLETLHIGQIRISDSGLACLQGLPSLKILTLVRTPITDKGLEVFRHMPLKSLDLKFTKITDAGLSALPNSLEFLYLDGTAITDKGISNLKHLSNLRVLTLRNNAITDKGVGELANLPKLEELRLNQTATSDQSCGVLAKLPMLERLTLSETAVTDSGLREIAKLKHLTDLFVEGDKIGDVGLGYLENMPALRRLSLENTEIGDDGVSALAHIQSLQSLDFNKTSITDVGLTRLASLKNLRTVELRSCPGVTTAGIDALRRKLPLLRIEYKR